MSDEIGNLADAESLLLQAIETDHPTQPVAPVVPEAAPEPAAVAPADPQVTPDQPAPEPTPDLFEDSNIDLTNLSPAEELRIRQMQAHFTRKTQEVAESKKEAAEAVAFVNALQNDPNYALQVHTQLSEALQQAGLTPAQADQAAAQQMQAQVDDVPDDSFDDESYWQQEQPQYRVPPEVQKQLDELSAWKATQEEESQRQWYAGEIQRQTMQIRQANPDYTDEDMETIYGLAFAYGGDLSAADAAFKAEQNRIITNYLTKKASVPAGQPVSAVSGAPPAGFDGDLNKAHTAALEHLARLQAEGLA